MGASLLMTLNLAAWAGDGWPLRNGDFSRANDFIPQAQDPDWRYHRYPGLTVTREDREPFDAVFKGKAGDSLWRPGVAILKAGPAHNAILYQKVWLLPGDYTFRIEASTSRDATLSVSVGEDNTQYSGLEWGEVKVDFSVKEADWVVVDLRTTKANEEVRVGNARINVRRIDSSPVKLEDGRALGEIVLPEMPTEAEEYAAWELQKFIFRMTGNAPGLKGRDQTTDGVEIKIGGAVGADALARLEGLAEESYLVATSDGNILLAGNSDRGTLYAAYDFLKQQGCGWFWPGPSGEVVPKRNSLKVEAKERIESPDYLIRGLDKKRTDWDHASWRTINLDDYIDWLVRNRQNALLASQAMTVDFGKWRGGSHVIRTNHSLFIFWWGAEPIKMEWAPLVSGERKPRHASGRVNMACTSNQAFRDRTVRLILEFFRQRPEVTVFGLNTDDEPANWCECPNCRAQDADKGAGPWKVSAKGRPPFPMTDRWLNYVNEVAERVAAVYPDKLIETYAYASTRPAPKRERVHSSVMIRFCFYPAEVPYGATIKDISYKPNDLLHQSLKDWQRAEPKHLCLYDYDNYRYPDSIFTWFFRLSDIYKTFNKDYGYLNYLAEHHGQFAASYMEHNLRARLLWNTHADYRAEIRDICDKLYGPVGDMVYEYYIHMDNVLLNYWKNSGDDWRGENAPEDFDSTYRALELHEYSFADMAAGQALLDKAWEAAGDDATLRGRLAPLRFGHAMSTLVLAMTADDVGRKVSQQEARQTETAWQLARDLRTEYRILGSSRLNRQLESFYIAPRVQRELIALPVVWKFKQDPEDQGSKENWYQKAPDDSWTDIRTDSAWTDQGHAYHGVAWYSIEFDLPDDARASLKEAARKGAAFLNEGGPGGAIYFGAVDGEADVFLDGKKIGEQKKPPSMMWKNPFAIRLSADTFEDGGIYRLTVRVKKESAAAGIWKPVRIVILAE